MSYTPSYCLIVTPSKELAVIMAGCLEGIGHRLVIAKDTIEANLKLQNQKFEIMMVLGMDYEKAQSLLKSSFVQYPNMKIWFYMEKMFNVEEMLFLNGNTIAICLPNLARNLKSHLEAFFMQKVEQAEVATTPLIYIVDDFQMNREVLEGMLTPMNCDFKSFATGGAVLEELKRKVPDLILLDYMMPDINGNEVLKIIRETHSKEDLPVIVISAQEDKKNIVALVQEGVNDYIVKPVDFKKLQEKFKKMGLLK